MKRPGVTRTVALATTLTATLGMAGAFYHAAREDGRELTDEYRQPALKAIENAGLTDARLRFSMTASFLKCSRSDIVGMDFEAKDAEGSKVSGHVCARLLSTHLHFSPAK